MFVQNMRAITKILILRECKCEETTYAYLRKKRLYMLKPNSRFPPWTNILNQELKQLYSQCKQLTKWHNSCNSSQI
jgi:hypothetical protein